MKIVTGFWLIFMLGLSHIGGTASSEESRWLASMTGVKEGTLRRSAHVVVYAVLGVLATVAWSDTALWIRCLALVTIAVADETSKALPCFPGRHCSVWPDMALNLLGCVIGVVVGLLISGI